MQKHSAILIPEEGYAIPLYAEQLKHVEVRKDVIVLSEDELLDLMQESIEHSHTTLLREIAVELLNAKLANR